MPVARIITQYPDQSEELVRQLMSAGYTVKFSAPDEEFDDADLVVSAANVHSDFALQYAAEVAQECGGEVVVAPGVVRAASSAPAAPIAIDAAIPTADANAGVTSGLRQRWQQFRDERALAREQKRLERERQAMEAEERRREAMQVRAAEEARLSAERERLRLEQQARDEQVRAEAEAERARIIAEHQRIAADRERLRLEREAQEQEQRQEQQELARRAEEAERERVAAAEHERLATAERERLAVAERERESQPKSVPVFYPPVSAPAVPIAASAAPVAAQRAVSRRAVVPSRSRTMQRAVIAASVVALILMIAFAIVINLPPSSPLPNGVVNNSVQEQSPFGPAHSPTMQPAPPVVHAAAPATKTTVRPAPAKPAAAHVARRAKHSDDGDVAQDEVIIHHYGQTTKRPPASQARAGIPHYSDQQQ